MIAVLSMGSLPVPSALRDNGKSKLALSSRSSLSSVDGSNPHQATHCKCRKNDTWLAQCKSGNALGLGPKLGMSAHSHVIMLSPG